MPSQASASAPPEIIVENGHSITGASRRASNLWTPEARDNMFSRRETGESWESICHDYPGRSRHAMQQQYSMMKKQRQLADGTWAVNRRGRKSKGADDGYGPRSKRGDDDGDGFETGSMNGSDILTEDDDLDLTDDPLPPVSNGPSQSVLDFRPGHRPAQLGRSATDPAPRKSKPKTTSGMDQVSTADTPSHSFTPLNSVDNKPVKRAATEMPTTASTSSKRVRTDLDQPGPHLEATSLHIPAAPRDTERDLSEGAEEDLTPAPTFDPENAGILFTQQDLSAFFTRGAESALKTARVYQEDRATSKDLIQVAITNATRQITEAEDRQRETAYLHKHDMRVAELDYLEKIGNLKLEHESQVEALGRELKTAQDLRVQAEGKFQEADAASRAAIAAAAATTAVSTISITKNVGQFQTLHFSINELCMLLNDLSPKAVAGRLAEIRDECVELGKNLPRVQSFTVAQATAEPDVMALDAQQEETATHSDNKDAMAVHAALNASTSTEPARLENTPLPKTAANHSLSAITNGQP